MEWRGQPSLDRRARREPKRGLMEAFARKPVLRRKCELTSWAESHSMADCGVWWWAGALALSLNQKIQLLGFTAFLCAAPPPPPTGAAYKAHRFAGTEGGVVGKDTCEGDSNIIIAGLRDKRGRLVTHLH